MPPTRREQLELDELLSDIYLGIESLPDRSGPSRKRNQRQQVETANSSSNPNNQQHSSYKTTSLGARQATNRSELSYQQEPQSLASIVTSTTPRRVRIVEPPDKRARDQQQVVSSARPLDHQAQPHQEELLSKSRRPPVKYVNTNKLIYHQERDSDSEDHYRESSYYNQDHHLVTSGRNYDSDDNNDYEEADDDDQFDGKTRLKYYHTTWLDRKLGRLPKRRSSKELTERQIKEKAMIEELKRNLKNGAITLRQSFKGSKSKSNNKSLDFYDLEDLNSFSTSPHKSPQPVKDYKSNGPVITGLATLPRKPQNSNKSNNKTNNKTNNKSNNINNSQLGSSTVQNQQQQQQPNKQQYSPVKTSFASPLSSSSQQTRNAMQTSRPEVSYSRTLPHKRAEHQLLQSHYRGAGNYSTVTNSPRSPGAGGNLHQEQQLRGNNIEATRTNYAGSRSPGNQFQQQQHQQPLGDTISSLPSATEVVRSALSRSGSATSLNQLNKTINLLPNSPSPCAPSPMTPTQQLRATTPTLSPSPNLTSAYYGQQQHQQQQPVYANPHAALMQHRAEEQMRRQGGRNQASIREFHELDSLLGSLSMATGPSVHVRPGLNTKPAQPTLGYGFANPINPQHQQPQQAPGATGAQRLTGQRVLPAPTQDLYARVQKQQTTMPLVDNEQTKASYLQQNYLTQNLTSGRDEFTIDVTNSKLTDENCIRQNQRQQNLSEFEPPIELLPSMEDYQNISKLNPVKNHYWYKPHMSRERAIELLKDKPQGTFIVRDSTSFQGAFGLAVKVSRLPKNVLNNASLRNPIDPSAELIRHFLIEPTPGGVRLKGYANEPIFGSLPALIYQHSLVELALPCKLVIPRADIEDKNFNLRQKQFYDEFLASKEIAKHLPYEIKSPDGGYRRYPGDVYVHNEHRIIYE